MGETDDKLVSAFAVSTAVVEHMRFDGSQNHRKTISIHYSFRVRCVEIPLEIVDVEIRHRQTYLAQVALDAPVGHLGADTGRWREDAEFVIVLPLGDLCRFSRHGALLKSNDLFSAFHRDVIS